MPKVPTPTPKRLIAALKRLGFYEVRQKGSHLRLERGNLQVTVPMHPGNVNPRVVRSILRQAQMTAEELRKAF
ncbi:MAG: type II toxin-antitoxin system HicA family toxin [Acidobacteria bacterium]|nr:type II toxin-antitoxin system HicA family toxin [Acidobacteriota bacterium]